jgi:excisionase family DNA binding protein
MEQIFLTPLDIASLLKISKAKVNRLISKEELPFTRYHCRVIVRLEDLIGYLLKNPPGNPAAGMEADKSPPRKRSDNERVQVRHGRFPFR